MPKRRLPEKDFAWDAKLAYAVGLLVTDGNLSNSGRHIVMRSAEIPMLETFKTCLDLQNKIGSTTRKDGRTHFRVQFGNVQFYDWLLRIGLTPAKNLTIGAINVPDWVFPDYLRGCIDGDGSIQTYSDKYNYYKGRNYITKRLFIRIVSGSERHIVWLQNKIQYLTKLHGAIIRRPPPDEKRSSLWELKFAKKESMKLIDWIYYDPSVPCLQRKRDVAENALKIISQQKQKKYELIN